MFLVRRTGLALVVALALPSAATAGPIIDFSDLAYLTFNTALGNGTVTYGGINITAYADTLGDGTFLQTELIVRNETNDHGLGVCSEGLPNCSVGVDQNGDPNQNGDGDDNELSQLVNHEAILLEKPAGWTWTGIWLSSLDGNDGSSAEDGRVYWSNDAENLVSFYSFTFPAFGGTLVEGSLNMTLLLNAGFDPNARFLAFTSGGFDTLGSNNDYLVWGVDVRRPEGDPAVPEPASLLLLGTGLLGLARARRRSRH